MTRSILGIAALLASAAALPFAAQAQVTAPDTGRFDGVFIQQIGDGNAGQFTQTDNTQNAEVVQDGDDNSVQVDQSGDADHYTGIDQAGDDNSAAVSQNGSAQNVALIGQTGTANIAILSQNNTGLLESGAAITQTGTGNLATLIQDGTDNQAVLTQNGDNNTMTATQLGDGNSLEWTQNGTGLPDMAIIQTGGAAAIVTQTN